MRALRIHLLIGLLLVFACQPEHLSPADYIKYVRNPENGFIQQVHVANLMIEAFYQPPNYVALMQSKPGSAVKVSVHKNLERQSGFCQFMVALRATSGLPIDKELAKLSGDPDSLELKKQHMLYRLEKSFTVLTENDSLPCVFYHAQPTGQVDNAYRFILAFESDARALPSNKREGLRLVYRDSLWFHRKFEFVFNQETILNAPKLKF